MDDEVVESIPVFLNKSLADNIHILQYPVLNHSINLANAHVVNSCVKPVTQQLKVDFALNSDSQNYDAFKGDQLGLMADGKIDSRNKNAKGEKPTFKSGRMDKQSYVSTISTQDVNRYVVGVFLEGELHLTPVHQIYQMRPSFSYFDKQDKRTKAEAKKDDDAGAEEEVRQVTVKFAKNENERIRKSREKSFSYLAQLKEEEPWCETMWYSADMECSTVERQKLTVSVTDRRTDFLNLCKDVYAKCLVNAHDSPGSSSEVPSKLEDVISTALLNAKVLSFANIQAKTQQKSTEKLLHALQTVGTLVRGNWVLKSELLYPEKSFSSINGVSAAFMIRAREFVLYQFSINDFVDRKKITIMTQLPTEEAREVIESVAEYKTEIGWVMRLPPNEEFELKYPDLVQRQQLYWNGKQEEFLEMGSTRTRKRSHRDSK